MAKCVRERTLVSFENGTIGETIEGYRLRGKIGGSSGGGGGSSIVEVDRFRVYVIARSVLLCRQVSETTGDYVPIAKPLELDPERATGDAGVVTAYTYPPATGTASEIAATQRWKTSQLSRETVYPAYQVGSSGSVIFAMKGMNSGTGVSYNGSTVEWMDMNTDGRIFLTDLNIYSVCVQGAYKSVLIRGSNPAA